MAPGRACAPRARADVAGGGAVRRPDRAREPHGRRPPGVVARHAPRHLQGTNDAGRARRRGARRCLHARRARRRAAERAHAGPAQARRRGPRAGGAAARGVPRRARRRAWTPPRARSSAGGCARSSTRDRDAAHRPRHGARARRSATTSSCSSSARSSRRARRTSSRRDPKVVEAYLGGGERGGRRRGPGRRSGRRERASERRDPGDRGPARRATTARAVVRDLTLTRRAGRGRRAARRQRRGQDDDAARHLGDRAADGGHDHGRRARTPRRLSAECGRPHGRRARARGPRHLLRPHRGRALPAGCRAASGSTPTTAYEYFPALARAARTAGRGCCPAASSRCSRSAARSCAARRCSCSTS